VEGEEVTGFVVGGAVLPALPEDADPFEGKCAQDGLMAFSGSLLLSVEGLGPDAARNGLADPFNKTLPQKLRAVPTPVHPHELAAFLADGCDARVFLQRSGIGIARAIGAERGEQAWGKRGSCTRQIDEQVGIGMSGEGCGDTVFQILDRGLQGTQLGDKQQGLSDGDVDDGCVGGEWPRGREVSKPFFNEGRTARVVGLIEAAQSRRARSLHRGERGPAVQEVERERGIHFVSDQLEELGKVRLEHAAQLVGEEAAQVDRFASGIDEQLKPPGWFAITVQPAQAIAMVFEEREQNLGIGRIVLGARGNQSLAETGAGRRMHRIDLQPGMFKQSMDNSVAAGLDHDRHGLTTEAFAHLIKPDMQSLRRSTDCSAFLRAPVREHKSVGGIAPVQRQTSDIF